MNTVKLISTLVLYLPIYLPTNLINYLSTYLSTYPVFLPIYRYVCIYPSIYPFNPSIHHFLSVSPFLPFSLFLTFLYIVTRSTGAVSIAGSATLDAMNEMMHILADASCTNRTHSISAEIESKANGPGASLPTGDNKRDVPDKKPVVLKGRDMVHLPDAHTSASMSSASSSSSSFRIFGFIEAQINESADGNREPRKRKSLLGSTEASIARAVKRVLSQPDDNSSGHSHSLGSRDTEENTSREKSDEDDVWRNTPDIFLTEKEHNLFSVAKATESSTAQIPPHTSIAPSFSEPNPKRKNRIQPMFIATSRDYFDAHQLLSNVSQR